MAIKKMEQCQLFVQLTPVALLSKLPAMMKKPGAAAQPRWSRKREQQLLAHGAERILTKEMG